MFNKVKKYASDALDTKSKSLLRKFVRLYAYPIFLFNGVVLFYLDEKRSAILDIIRKVKKEKTTVLADNEAYQLYMLVNSTQKVKGDIAEVGAYQGGSSKIICEAKKKKNFYIFDTFEGLPSPSKNDDGFAEGQYRCSMEEVKEYLKGYKNVRLYKGLFPKTAFVIMNKKFSFVHLDVDLYDSTLESLKFFYPRMSRGGIILSHDYINSVGVRKAFEEFFKDKPEPIVEMSGSQCMIVKL